MTEAPYRPTVDALILPLREEVAVSSDYTDAALRCGRAGELVAALQTVLDDLVKVRDAAAQEMVTRVPPTHRRMDIAALMRVDPSRLSQLIKQWGLG